MPEHDQPEQGDQGFANPDLEAEATEPEEQATEHEDSAAEAENGEIEVLDASFDEADDANVPVNIRLFKERDSETEEETGFFILDADNYTPRKQYLAAEYYAVRSKDPELLKQVVTEKIIPLYEQALANLRGIADGTNTGFEYWAPPEKYRIPSASEDHEA